LNFYSIAFLKMKTLTLLLIILLVFEPYSCEYDIECTMPISVNDYNRTSPEFIRFEIINNEQNVSSCKKTYNFSCNLSAAPACSGTVRLRYVLAELASVWTCQLARGRLHIATSFNSYLAKSFNLNFFYCEMLKMFKLKSNLVDKSCGLLFLSFFFLI